MKIPLLVGVGGRTRCGVTICFSALAAFAAAGFSVVAVVAGGVLAYAADEACPCELVNLEGVDVEDVGE